MLSQQCRQHLDSVFAAADWDTWLASQLLLSYSCEATDPGLYEIKVQYMPQRSETAMRAWGCEAAGPLIGPRIDTYTRVLQHSSTFYSCLPCTRRPSTTRASPHPA